MDRTEVRELLDAVADGRLSVTDAETQLQTAPLSGFTDLGFARLDTHRGLRTGDPEVVYAAGKSTDQLVALLHALADQPGRRPALATRLTDDMAERLSNEFTTAQIDRDAKCAVIGDLPRPEGGVVWCCAGAGGARGSHRGRHERRAGRRRGRVRRARLRRRRHARAR